MNKILNIFVNRKFVLFFLGGGISYLLKAFLSWLFSEKIAWPFLLSYALTLIIVIMYNFTYNVLVTFKVKGKLADRFVRYIIFVGLFNGLDYLLVNTLVGWAPWSYQISIFLVTGILMFVKFVTFNRWVFQERKEKKKENE